MDKKAILNKIAALRSKAATEGERAAADKAIKRICSKYGIDELSITSDDSDDLSVGWHSFKWNTKLNERLLAQCITYHVGFHADMHFFKREILVEVTDAQAIEIDFMYDYYKQLLAEEIELLYTAFLAKHDIYASDTPYSTNDDSEYLDRLSLMVESLSDSQFRKALTEGEDGQRDRK